MAAARENPQSFSTVHDFEQGHHKNAQSRADRVTSTNEFNTLW
jgi:hypothetical protein